MTTLEAVRLTPALEALIDARLDTIDRMLLGAVPRQDRLAIVRDVEAQIHEQLQARGADELSREGVLAVLAALDPPEAYLPELADDPDRRIGAMPLRAGLRSDFRTVCRTEAASGSGRASGVLGIVTLFGSLFLPAMVWLTVLNTESMELLVVGVSLSTLLVLTGAVLAIVFAARAGLRTAWAISGFVTGLAAAILMLACDAVGLMFLA